MAGALSRLRQFQHHAGRDSTPYGNPEKRKQADLVRDVIATAAGIDNCIGVFYWEGPWISSGGKSYDENLALWQKYGSGWATSYAAEYDPNDAGKWYGGCAVDNQAFFDKSGKALESLKVFALLREGNEVNNK